MVCYIVQKVYYRLQFCSIISVFDAVKRTEDSAGEKTIRNAALELHESQSAVMSPNTKHTIAWETFQI